MEDTFTASDFTSAAASASAPAVTSEVASTPDSTAPETAATVPAETAGITPEPKGPIPFEVHHTALANAREKAKQEALAEWRSKHGWAEQTNPEQFRSFAEAAQAYQRNPVEFLERLAVDPQHGPAVRSFAGRLLAQQRQRAEPPPPGPDLVAENGAGVFSAQRQAEREQWLVQKIVAHFEQRLQPVQQFAQTQAQQQFEERARAQANELAAATFKEASEWPGFTDKQNQIAMRTAMEADPNLSFDRAYIKVVLPNLSKVERTKVLADLNQKSSASTLNPSTARTAPLKTPKEESWSETFKRVAAESGGR